MEYNPFCFKASQPELVSRFNIPLDEYPRRCVEQFKGWDEEYQALVNQSTIPHTRSREYASYIMKAMVTGNPFKIGGNVLNRGGLIGNLPEDACVEMPCFLDRNGVNPCRVGDLPLQLAAMNMTNKHAQLLTIQATATQKREHIYHAALLDPHTAAELSTDQIMSMVDDLIDAHDHWLPQYS